MLSAQEVTQNEKACLQTAQQFQTVLDERLERVISPPPAQPKNFFTLAPKLFIATFILGIGAVSASFSIGPSKDESDHLNTETDINDQHFYVSAMWWFVICSLFTNALQASGIIVDALLTLIGVHERSDDEKLLLEQPTFCSILSHNKHSVATLILATVAALSMGELAAEDAPDNSKTILLFLVWALNIPLSERGLRDAVEAIPFTPANYVDSMRVKLGSLNPDQAAQHAAARKAKHLLSKRLHTSFDNFLQISQADDRQAIIDSFKNPALSTADKLCMLLNLTATQPNIESGPTTHGRRPATHPLSSLRLWGFVAPVTLLMIAAQNGYVFASKNGIESLVENSILGIVWLALAGGVYGGLTLESTVALTSNAFSGRKTLHQVLHPKTYKIALIIISLLGGFSGAPLADTNWQTTGGVPEQTAVYLPRNLRFANEALGGMSDPMANIYFALLCLQDLTIEWVKYFEENSHNRELIYFYELIKAFSSDFDTMPLHKFIDLLNAPKLNSDANQTTRFLDTQNLIEFFRENNITDKEISLLFPTLTAEEKANYNLNPDTHLAPTEKSPLLGMRASGGGQRHRRQVSLAPSEDLVFGNLDSGDELQDFSSDGGSQSDSSRRKKSKPRKPPTDKPPTDLENNYAAAPPPPQNSAQDSTGASGNNSPLTFVKAAAAALAKLQEESHTGDNQDNQLAWDDSAPGCG